MQADAGLGFPMQRSLPVQRQGRPLRAFFLIPFLILLLLPSAALAHTGHGGVAASELIQVGPYKAVVEFSEYPPVAHKSLQIVIVPEGGIESIKGGLRFIPAEGKAHGANAFPYPGIPDALTLNHDGFPHEGSWQIEVHLVGPQGAGVGNLQPMLVAPPPAFPTWLGWLMAATPVLIYLGYLGWAHRQFQRARLADSGAWT